VLEQVLPAADLALDSKSLPRPLAVLPIALSGVEDGEGGDKELFAEGGPRGARIHAAGGHDHRRQAQGIEKRLIPGADLLELGAEGVGEMPGNIGVVGGNIGRALGWRIPIDQPDRENLPAGDADPCPLPFPLDRQVPELLADTAHALMAGDELAGAGIENDAREIAEFSHGNLQAFQVFVFDLSRILRIWNQIRARPEIGMPFGGGGYFWLCGHFLYSTMFWGLVGGGPPPSVHPRMGQRPSTR
jgi:hypothetical protein